MRFIPPGSYQHIYNRGVLKMKLFRCPADYCRFLYKMEEYRTLYKIKIIEFCLMPNHFHILVQEPFDDSAEAKQISTLVISKFMQKVQLSYSRYFVVKYNHSGCLLQGRFKNKIITDNRHFLTVREYILNNPVRKKLVSEPALWPYSSASVYRNRV